MDTWEDRVKTWLKGLFGDSQEKKLKVLQTYVDSANSYADKFAKLSDDELRAKTAEFRTRIENALKNVANTPLMPPDAPKMPGQLRIPTIRFSANCWSRCCLRLSPLPRGLHASSWNAAL